MECHVKSIERRRRLPELARYRLRLASTLSVNLQDSSLHRHTFLSCHLRRTTGGSYTEGVVTEGWTDGGRSRCAHQRVHAAAVSWEITCLASATDTRRKLSVIRRGSPSTRKAGGGAPAHLLFLRGGVRSPRNDIWGMMGASFEARKTPEGAAVRVADSSA